MQRNTLHTRSPNKNLFGLLNLHWFWAVVTHPSVEKGLCNGDQTFDFVKSRHCKDINKHVMSNFWQSRGGGGWGAKSFMVTFNKINEWKNKESTETALLIAPFISCTIMKNNHKKDWKPKIIYNLFFLKWGPSSESLFSQPFFFFFF